MTYSGQPTVNYDSPFLRRRTSGMAIASMICSICGLLLACLLIGIPICLVGLILGIVAMVQIKNRPDQLGGKGFAITGIVVGCLGFLGIGVLIIPILLPSLGRARELSNRGYCAANLRGIMQSCNIYAADNGDAFPVIGTRSSFTAGGSRYDAGSAAGTPSSVADSTITSYYSGSYSGAPVYQNMWILVLKNQVAPKQFICKSDPVASSVPAPQTSGTDYNVTFTNGSSLDLKRMSYSVAYPYNDRGEVGGWWKAVTDSTLPLIADIAPLNGESSGSATINTTDISGSPRSFNSRNHGGDGQVVGYSDVHATFERRPDVGAYNDNIWTSGGASGPDTRGAPITTGGAILPIGTYRSPWDTILVPVRTASGDTR